MSRNAGGRGEETPDFPPAGPSGQLGSKSALSEPLLVCFTLGVLVLFGWVLVFFFQVF